MSNPLVPEILENTFLQQHWLETELFIIRDQLHEQEEVMKVKHANAVKNEIEAHEVFMANPENIKKYNNFRKLEQKCGQLFIGSTKSSGITHLVPVTVDEEEKQTAESSMSNKELILIIQSLIELLNETNCPQFKGLATKKKDELLLILQQVKDLHKEIEEII
nr:8397_t:CDS:2 [Entrophospora candida]